MMDVLEFCGGGCLVRRLALMMFWDSDLSVVLALPSGAKPG